MTVGLHVNCTVRPFLQVKIQLKAIHCDPFGWVPHGFGVAGGFVGPTGGAVITGGIVGGTGVGFGVGLGVGFGVAQDPTGTHCAPDAGQYSLTPPTHWLAPATKHCAAETFLGVTRRKRIPKDKILITLLYIMVN